ncbi:Flavonol synthase/flavanone 3-hydroxylase [Triticum urartu]|uniref:Flavonol synthase/flavanone 3-hydroxylase n=1 Tax=Triticum urartu TaxID=4572 RepID=M7Z3K6_TRIUA|nr:Flavonol synthase/flavanone 3-hydroxylase [Triticum urartu]
MASPPSGASSEQDGIPVVDLAVLLNGDAGERSQAIRHLGRACQHWGFFMVTNHGVPEALQSAMMDACRELFGLPPEEKAEFMDAGPMDPNAVDGLQVMHDGRWLLAKPIPGAFFVIAGDQLEIVSNGRYKGVLHRALVDREQARMSCVSLIGPCLDAVVEPVPELAVPPLGLGLEFRGVKYRDYMEHQQSNKLNDKGALDLVRVQKRPAILYT